MNASGDRHLRSHQLVRLGDPIPGDRIVQVEADPQAARTFAGQATLSLLVDLLARQFGVVSSVKLVVPAVQVHGRAFPRNTPLAGSNLDAALAEILEQVSGGEIAVSDPGARPDLVVHVGRGRGGEGRIGTIQCLGHGWSAFCSSHSEPPDVVLTSTLAFGPHLAAALAADRVFRAFRGVAVGGTFECDLYDLVPTFAVAGGPDLIDLPPAYIIGLGAVGAAAAYTFAASAGVRAVFVGMDDDIVDETSRNRLLSADYHDVGCLKTDLASALFAGSETSFFGNTERFTSYFVDAHRKAPPELMSMEPIRIEYLMSFVDKNLSRAEIAAYTPRHTISGSTDGLRAECAYYSVVGECECLACNHPAVGPDHDAIVAKLKGMAPVARNGYLSRMGASRDEAAAISDYLADPACGLAGEHVLRRLGMESEAEWSVGFVSAAAGILAAARFAVLALQGPPSDSEVRLYFEKAGSMSTSRGQRKTSCAICGGPQTAELFAIRWGTDRSP